MKVTAISENHLYKKAYVKGQKAFGRHIVVYVLTDYHAARLARANPLKKKINLVGLAVSKKTGGAVTRSRIKRIIRAAYQSLEKKNDIKKGFLIVLAAKQSAADAKSTDIYDDLIYTFGKLKMFASGEQK